MFCPRFVSFWILPFPIVVLFNPPPNRLSQSFNFFCIKRPFKPTNPRMQQGSWNNPTVSVLDHEIPERRNGQDQMIDQSHPISTYPARGIHSGGSGGGEDDNDNESGSHDDDTLRRRGILQHGDDALKASALVVSPIDYTPPTTPSAFLSMDSTITSYDTPHVDGRDNDMGMGSVLDGPSPDERSLFATSASSDNVTPDQVPQLPVRSQHSVSASTSSSSPLQTTEPESSNRVVRNISPDTKKKQQQQHQKQIPFPTAAAAAAASIAVQRDQAPILPSRPMSVGASVVSTTQENNNNKNFTTTTTGPSSLDVAITGGGPTNIVVDETDQTPILPARSVSVCADSTGPSLVDAADNTDPSTIAVQKDQTPNIPSRAVSVTTSNSASRAIDHDGTMGITGSTTSITDDDALLVKKQRNDAAVDSIASSSSFLSSSWVSSSSSSSVLFGRQDEIRYLEDIFEAVLAESNSSNKSSNDTQHVVWIGGEPGTGKSALARSVYQNSCRRVGGIYLQGKFNFSSSPAPISDNHMNPGQTVQSTNNRNTTRTSSSVPYSALIEACMGVVDDIRLVYYGYEDQMEDNDLSGNGKSGGMVDGQSVAVPNFFGWKFPKSFVHQLWDDHYDELQVLLPIFPNLHMLFEGQGHGPHSNTKLNHHQQPAEEAKQAIQQAFCRFFDVLMTLSPVVVLLIDDWQWCCDESTLEVLDALLKSNNSYERITKSGNNGPATDRMNSATNDGRYCSSCGRLLVVGTVRTDEETIQNTAYHTLEQLLARTMKAQQDMTVIKTHEVSVDALTSHDVVQWLQALLVDEKKVNLQNIQSAILHGEYTVKNQQEQALYPLAECIMRRTAGNAYVLVVSDYWHF